MALVFTLTFDFELNTSLQVGDNVYWTSTGSLGGFDQQANISSQQHLGVVQNIVSPNNLGQHDVIVFSEYDVLGVPISSIYPPPPGAYISFSKSRAVNNNELLGYYALLKFENDSNHPAKLWAVGTEITENSK
jgi:hypothetical protein|tara:strand:- start:126 stop:524 length:399 start_codon:yes stop_codon:yes gene_type:complete